MCANMPLLSVRAVGAGVSCVCSTETRGVVLLRPVRAADSARRAGKGGRRCLFARHCSTTWLGWRALDSTSKWQPICLPMYPLSEHPLPACNEGVLVVPKLCWSWPVFLGPLELLRSTLRGTQFHEALGLAWMSQPAVALSEPIVFHSWACRAATCEPP